MRKEKDLGAQSATAVVSAGQAAHAQQLSHDEIVRELREAASAPARLLYIDDEDERRLRDAMHAAADHLVGWFLVPAWQPIETAPKDGTWLLVIAIKDVRNGRPDQSLARWSARGRWITVPGAYAIYPTHWMPLPAPPVVGNEDQLLGEASPTVPSEAR